jgi:hypothetical protein
MFDEQTVVEAVPGNGRPGDHRPKEEAAVVTNRGRASRGTGRGGGVPEDSKEETDNRAAGEGRRAGVRETENVV